MNIMVSFDEFAKIFDHKFWQAVTKKSRLPYDKKINKGELLKTLYSELLNRTYYPSLPRGHIIFQKEHGICRKVPVFQPKDYCVYFYCIKSLEEFIAQNRTPNTFGGWRLGGKLRKKETVEINSIKQESDKYDVFMAEDLGISVWESSYDPISWSKAYGDFNAKLLGECEINDLKQVVEFDIANFYDTIRLDILEERIKLSAGSENAYEVSLLFHFLNYWDRATNLYNRKCVGLPQDEVSDCSRILANFYLQDYDQFLYEKCQEVGATYFRYADDQFIFATTMEDLKQLLYLASLYLSDLGLNINQKKVKYFRKKELIQSRAYKIFDQLNGDMDQLNDVVNELLSMSKEQFERFHNSGIPILNKLIYKDLNKLDDCVLSKILDCFYLSESYLTHPRIDDQKLYKIYTLIKEDLKKGEFIEALKAISNRFLHNYFHYVVLKLFKKTGSDSSCVNSRIQNIQNLSQTKLNTTTLKHTHNEHTIAPSVPTKLKDDTQILF